MAPLFQREICHPKTPSFEFLSEHPHHFKVKPLSQGRGYSSFKGTDYTNQISQCVEVAEGQLMLNWIF